MVPIAGPAACAPSSATSSGTPMKPVFGKAATSAPKAASRRSTPSAPGRRAQVIPIVSDTISSALVSQTASSPGSISCSSGRLAPKRYSMHGSAKYSTKAFSPGIAAAGSMPWRAPS